MNLLFVDDEAYRTKAYRDALSQAGHDVIFCSTFDEASSLLYDSELDIDLLIQDLQMGRPVPGDRFQISNSEWEDFQMLSGLWFLHRFRHLLFNRKIPVLVLTQKTAGEWRQVLINTLDKNGVWCEVHQKVHTPAARLPAIIKEFIDRIDVHGWPCPNAHTP